MDKSFVEKSRFCLKVIALSQLMDDEMIGMVRNGKILRTKVKDLANSLMRLCLGKDALALFDLGNSSKIRDK